ncbi:MAG: MucBP domain-containing protein, partial [Acutalibacteraceae bacterium]
MQKSKNGIFKKVLSSVLSAACVLSTGAFIGTASATSVDAATYTKPAEGSPATFSWDNASVYFLLTDRFNNGDPSNDHSYGRGLDQDGNVVSYDNYAAFQGGDFKGITDKINEGYFNDLGVNAIWLSAPYEQIHGYCVGCNGESFAHYSYHGYYVLDYTESDKNFGTKEEFRELVDTAHEHGIRIVMDIVMNHSGYNTLKDMDEFGFGPVKSGWESYYYSHQNVNNTDYHSYIDYESSDSADSWAKWWGPDWIRCGLPGYTQGGGDIEGSLAGLPDFKTGSSTQVGIPEVLKTKWTQEGTYDEKVAKYGKSNTVTGYLSDWLAEWVREFGVDGFRCDTAKHVELSAWKILKDKCVKALREWKAENPTKKLDDLDFWMTGECFGHQVGKSSYYTDGGFDSMINFEFAPAVNSSNVPSAGSVESIYNRYASSINSDKNFNALSYLASHDTTLIKGDRKYAGSFLLMLPGGIQIYYGDETNRPFVNSPFANVDPGAGHQFRGFMNWDSVDTDVLSHWQKVGQFRNNHIAVGAGQHKAISGYSSSTGYTFARTYDDGTIQDTIVATLFAAANTDITVDVSSVWSDGIEITNAYDGSTCKVSGGKVTFNSGDNGTILMQEPQGAKGKVIVKHINKTTGETIKTETMAGLLGDAYATSPLASLTDYYAVSSVTGPTTGTYSETEKTVTYYYVFDSANNGIIKVKYVDNSTGAEIADSDESYGKIGSTYSVAPKSIKNYEVDESKTTNASGTVKSGTTTVVFRYNYVEPTNVQIHYYNSNNWSSVAMYVYDETSGVVEYTGKWPGKTMTNEGDGWFYGEVEAETATFIANNNGGGSQDPAGGGTPGYSVTGEVWIKGGKVYPTGKVNVRYVTSTGTVLATETLKGMVDGSNKYTTSAKTFDGYTLESTPSNATGVFSETAVTVTYTYKANGTP